MYLEIQWRVLRMVKRNYSLALLISEKKVELNFIRIIPINSNPIFSRTLNIPTFVPSAVPKHPQSISKPLNKLIIIAIMKITSKLLIIAEFKKPKTPRLFSHHKTTVNRYSRIRSFVSEAA